MQRRTLVKNAAFNVLRGTASALVALLLPPVLTRVLPLEIYSTWVLILQLGAYIALLDFGLQTAVGRYVAVAGELSDDGLRDQVVSTSFVILCIASLIGLALIAGIAWQLPNIFREMPASLYESARIALLTVGGSYAVGLPFSVFVGVFIGKQRFEVPSLIIAGGKLIGAGLVAATAVLRGSIVAMAVVLAAANIATYLVEYAAFRRAARDVKLSSRSVTRHTARELAGYCYSLTIWSFATLLVTGLDMVVVGLFDYGSVGFYAVAASIVTFVLGLMNAIFGVLIPSSAVLAAQNNRQELGRVLLYSTRYGMLMLMAVSLPLITFAYEVLARWVGETYAVQSAPILQMLLVANIVRLSAMPYAMLLIGTGEQRLVILSPVVEGVTNLMVSVALGALLGAIGVAIGTFIGACVGIAFNLVRNMPKTKAIAIDRHRYVFDGLLRPLLGAAPCLAVVATAPAFTNTNPGLGLWIGIAALVISVFLLWQVGLSFPERHTILRLATARGVRR